MEPLNLQALIPGIYATMLNTKLKTITNDWTKKDKIDFIKDIFYELVEYTDDEEYIYQLAASTKLCMSLNNQLPLSRYFLDLMGTTSAFKVMLQAILANVGDIQQVSRSDENIIFPFVQPSLVQPEFWHGYFATNIDKENQFIKNNIEETQHLIGSSLTEFVLREGIMCPTFQVVNFDELKPTLQLMYIQMLSLLEAFDMTCDITLHNYISQSSDNAHMSAQEIANECGQIIINKVNKPLNPSDVLEMIDITALKAPIIDDKGQINQQFDFKLEQRLNPINHMELLDYPLFVTNRQQLSVKNLYPLSIDIQEEEFTQFDYNQILDNLYNHTK